MPPGEPETLAGAIRRAMDEPAALAEIAKRGSAFADRAFGWDAIVGDLGRVYDAAVEKRRSANS